MVISSIWKADLEMSPNRCSKRASHQYFFTLLGRFVLCSVVGAARIHSLSCSGAEKCRRAMSSPISRVSLREAVDSQQAFSFPPVQPETTKTFVDRSKQKFASWCRKADRFVTTPRLIGFLALVALLSWYQTVCCCVVANSYSES
jgi:hypothetical protein